MRKSLIIIVLIITNSLMAQEPRPSWAKNIPQPEKGANYIYVVGMGIGKTLKQATADAWANAFEKSMHEIGGITISQQTLKDIRENGVDGVASLSRLPKKVVCEPDPIYTPEGTKVYLLLQVQRNTSLENDFYTATPIRCDDKEFETRLKEYNKDEEQRRKSLEKQQQKDEKRNSSKFFSNGHNNFLSFSFGNGINYGNIIGLGFMGRHGGRVGIGYQVGGGLGGDHLGNYYMHYSAGLKLYPYKTIFIGGSYGTLAMETTTTNNTGNNWAVEGLKKTSGLSFLAGYDLCWGNVRHDAPGGVLSMGIGSSYTENKTWTVAWNVGLGWIF